MRPRNVAVCGGDAGGGVISMAYDVGKGIALEGWVLVCGGLGGVMEAAARGAFENGGTTIGILPGYDHASANRYISIAVPTGLGHARNAVIAASADIMVAIGGEYGTLSEVALGLKMGKTVISLASWGDIKGVVRVSTAAEAIDAIKGRLV